MLLVGLTGGIASGKSVVAFLYERQGAYVRRADQDAHRLMAPGSPVWSDIQARFGQGILASDGTIDRGILGRLVFADAAARKDLEAIIHPRAIAAMKEEAARIEAEGRIGIFISESALVFESGQADFFDKIVVVYCRPEIHLERLMARDRIDRLDASQRIAAQLDPREKKARADYVIDTSDDLEETLARAEAVWAFLMEDAARKKSGPSL
jgi:dephospho-CoA kinase